MADQTGRESLLLRGFPLHKANAEVDGGELAVRRGVGAVGEGGEYEPFSR